MSAGRRIDHLLYGVRDLDEAAERFEREHGLRSVDGGRHPGVGTANRIVPLGGVYVELVAVVDPEEAEGSPLGRALAAHTAVGDGLMGWVVATDDIAAEAGRLSLPALSMSRELPDGGTLEWDVVGIAEAVARQVLPFFIHWRRAELHPGRLAAGDAQAGRIAWIELAVDGDELARWLGDNDLPVRLVDGREGLRAAGLEVGGREIVLR